MHWWSYYNNKSQRKRVSVNRPANKTKREEIRYEDQSWDPYKTTLHVRRVVKLTRWMEGEFGRRYWSAGWNYQAFGAIRSIGNF